MTTTIKQIPVATNLFAQIRKHELGVYFVGLFDLNTGAFLKHNYASLKSALRAFNRLSVTN